MLLFSLAFAGDPCPIDFVFTEVTPSWRNRTEDLGKLNQQKRLYGISYRERGGVVTVVELVPHTAADERLQVGDVVKSIGTTPITSMKDVDTGLDAAAGGVAKIVVERQGKAVEVQVGPSPIDPIAFALFHQARESECSHPSFGRLTEAQVADVHQAAFDENRAFRCDDAHKRFQATYAPGTSLIIRGGRRVLLTMPGWHTLCVGVEDTDTPKLEQDAEQLQERLTRAYVADRHANP